MTSNATPRHNGATESAPEPTKTPTKTMNGENNNDDDPFTLIEKGNALESSENHWGASDFFSRAAQVLKKMALDLHHQIQLQLQQPATTKNDNTSKRMIKRREEQRKIADLYQTQSVEYLNRARDCLVRALQFEQREDHIRATQFEKHRMNDHASSITAANKYRITPPTTVEQEHDGQQHMFQPLMFMLSHDDIERRRSIFQRVFATNSFSNMVESNTNSPLEKNNHAKGQQTDDDGEVQAEEAPVSKVTKTETAVQTDDALEDSITLTPTDDLDLPVVVHKIPSNEQEEDDDNDGGDGVENKKVPEESIEQRLANLDSTLPPRLKSEGQRINEIHNGLKNLGVYVPSDIKEDKRKILNELEDQQMTEEEQLHQIMSMAHDEVALGKNDDDNDVSVPSYNDVEDLLRKSGIRVVLPGEEEDLDSNDSSDESDDDEETDENTDVESVASSSAGIPEDKTIDEEHLRNILSKSQNLLQKASTNLHGITPSDNGASQNGPPDVSNAEEGKKSSDIITTTAARSVGMNELAEVQQIVNALVNSMPNNDDEVEEPKSESAESPDQKQDK